MIEGEFDRNTIRSVDFGVSLKSTGQRFVVPADVNVQDALRDVLNNTCSAFDRIEEDWQNFDLTEDYGLPRKIYIATTTPELDRLGQIFAADTFDDLGNILHHIRDVEFYFATFRDGNGRKLIGVKKAVQIKATLKARGRLIRWADNTLQVVEDDILKIDNDFDLLIATNNIYVLSPSSFEQVANLAQRILTIAIERLDRLQQAVTFLDLSGLAVNLNSRMRSARAVCVVSEREDLGLIRRDLLEALATQHGVTLTAMPDGRLRPATANDETALLEMLDSRRYGVDLTGQGPVPYRATGRHRVSIA